MKLLKIIILCILTSLLVSCNNEKFSIVAIKTASSDFESATITDWTAGVAEFLTAASLDSIKLRAGRDTLPSALNSTRYAFHVYSRNPGTSLFTYIKRQITGLNPVTAYNVVFEINLATNYPQNAAAGASVYLKAGASPIQPSVDGQQKFNLSKGTGAADGKQLVSLGNVSNDTNKAGYLIVERNNLNKPVSVVSDQTGKIWLCVGFDSGYNGPTDLYFDSIKATITQN